MKLLVAVCGVALLAACSSESMAEKLIREHDARIAAIPAKIDAEYTAKYGPDKSKWPKNPAEGIQSTCETYYVSVPGAGIIHDPVTVC